MLLQQQNQLVTQQQDWNHLFKKKTKQTIDWSDKTTESKMEKEHLEKPLDQKQKDVANCLNISQKYSQSKQKSVLVRINLCPCSLTVFVLSLAYKLQHFQGIFAN